MIALLLLAVVEIGIPSAALDEAGALSVSLPVVNMARTSVDLTGLQVVLVDADGTRTPAAPVRYWLTPGMRRSVRFAFPLATPGARAVAIEIAGLPGGSRRADLVYAHEELDAPVQVIDPLLEIERSDDIGDLRRSRNDGLGEFVVQIVLELCSKR